MPRIFTVISPHIKDYDNIQTQVLDFFRAPQYEAFIVKETGKKGTHPHLNVIWTTKLHSKYYSQKLKQLFKAPNSNGRLLKHKAVFNEQKLRDDYLSKEANAEVIFDVKKEIDFHGTMKELYDDIRSIRRHRTSLPATGTKAKKTVLLNPGADKLIYIDIPIKKTY